MLTRSQVIVTVSFGLYSRRSAFTRSHPNTTRAEIGSVRDVPWPLSAVTRKHRVPGPDEKSGGIWYSRLFVDCVAFIRRGAPVPTTHAAADASRTSKIQVNVVPLAPVTTDVTVALSFAWYSVLSSRRTWTSPAATATVNVTFVDRCRILLGFDAFTRMT
ncbi:MAG TPA: hypothetical protein VEM95_03715 [Thermoplasmata archaeon]|nr:hypothetical protein [Thermoplasmata archaeon]